MISSINESPYNSKNASIFSYLKAQLLELDAPINLKHLSWFLEDTKQQYKLSQNIISSLTHIDGYNVKYASFKYLFGNKCAKIKDLLKNLYSSTSSFKQELKKIENDFVTKICEILPNIDKYVNLNNSNNNESELYKKYTQRTDLLRMLAIIDQNSVNSHEEELLFLIKNGDLDQFTMILLNSFKKPVDIILIVLSLMTIKVESDVRNTQLDVSEKEIINHACGVSVTLKKHYNISQQIIKN